MNKHFLFLCVFACILLAACSPAAVGPSAAGTPAQSASQATISPLQTDAPDSAAPSLSASPPQTAETGEAASASHPAEPSNSAKMYSSYAHMASFDPETGWAAFDYFDILRQDAAVQWLVENEGYTQASAEAEVGDFADSEFIEKNTNPQLRTIDLNQVTLTLMYHPDGTQAEGANPVPSTVDGLRALYALDPSLVLQSFFYYVEVQNDRAVQVDQVYWP